MKSGVHVDEYSRRGFLKTLGAGVALSFVSKQAWPTSQPVRKPDIVILLADDLGWRDVGYHGAEFDT